MTQANVFFWLFDLVLAPSFSVSLAHLSIRLLAQYFEPLEVFVYSPYSTYCQSQHRISLEHHLHDRSPSSCSTIGLNYWSKPSDFVSCLFDTVACAVGLVGW